MYITLRYAAAVFAADVMSVAFVGSMIAFTAAGSDAPEMVSIVAV